MPTRLGALVALGALVMGCGEIRVPADPPAGPSSEPDGSPEAEAGTACTFGDDSSCDDSDNCTIDRCNSLDVCEHEPREDVCKVGGICYDDGAANPAQGCEVCDIEADKSGWSTLGCDDGDDCTIDTCAAAGGCETVAADNGTACDDGLACTTDEACVEGICAGSPCCQEDLECVGEVLPGPCGRPSCVDGSCSAVPDADKNGNSCNDGKADTEDDQCVDGVCVGEPVGGPCEDHAECDDGLFCNGAEKCGLDGECGEGSAPAVPDGLEAGLCEALVCSEDDEKWVVEPLEVGAPCDDGVVCTEGESCTAEGSCGGGESVCAGGILQPRAPDADTFMWQGSQTDFIDSNDVPCTGRVAVSVGKTALCYASAEGPLRCAGSIYEEEYGSIFQDTELSDVAQVALSPELWGPGTTSACALKTDGTLWCRGQNDMGMFGQGHEEPVSTFSRFGGADHPALGPFALGDWTKLCSLSQDGAVVWCAGGELGAEPVKVGGPATSVWIDVAGEHTLDDPAIWRASSGLSMCQVTGPGLRCGSQFFGPEGEIVDGRYAVPLEAEAITDDICWLRTDGVVECRVQAPGGTKIVEGFSTDVVLALAIAPFSKTRCVVYRDGSLACIGENQDGKLGNGTTLEATSELEVAPPGSVHVGCP